MLKNLSKELKEFILRGNVIDMAVGIIIGAAFGKIVDSLVKDIIMPPIGLILGKVNFSDLYFQIYPRNIHYDSLSAAQNAGAVTINYGLFLNTIISFIIVACAVFFVIKSISVMKKSVCKQAEVHEGVNERVNEGVNEPETKTCRFCYTVIPVKAVRCPNCTSDLG